MQIRALIHSNAFQIVYRITVVLLISFIYRFLPVDIYQLLVPYDFRMGCSLFTDDLIIYFIVCCGTTLFILSNKDTRRLKNYFTAVSLKGIRHAILIGVTLGMIILFVSRFIRSDSRGDFDGYPDYQIIIICLFLAPITEELFFRGLIISYLKPAIFRSISLGKYQISIPMLISVSLFSVGHVLCTTGFTTASFTLILTYAFIVGLFAGYQYEKTNNIIIPILIHSFSNAVTVLPGLFLGEFY